MEEGVAHTAGDDEVIDFVEQVGDDFEFGRYLAAADDGREGMTGVVEHHVEVGGLLIEQVASVALAGEELRDGGGGGVCAVGGAEGVVDVQVAETGDLAGEILVAGLLFSVEAQVFEQRHLARFQRGHLLLHVSVEHIAEELHGCAEHLGGLADDMLQRELVGGHPLRTAQMRHEDGDAALVLDLLHRGDGAHDAGGVGHLQLFVQRHIIVHSDQYFLSLQGSQIDRFHRVIFLLIDFQNSLQSYHFFPTSPTYSSTTILPLEGVWALNSGA